MGLGCSKVKDRLNLKLGINYPGEKHLLYFSKISLHAFNKKSGLIVGQVLFFVKTGFNRIKEGAIGLAFKLFDLIFHVVRVLGVVVELGVIRTYTRMSNVTNL